MTGKRIFPFCAAVLVVITSGVGSAHAVRSSTAAQSTAQPSLSASVGGLVASEQLRNKVRYGGDDYARELAKWRHKRDAKRRADLKREREQEARERIKRRAEYAKKMEQLRKQREQERQRQLAELKKKQELEKQVAARELKPAVGKAPAQDDFLQRIRTAFSGDNLRPAH